MYLNQTFETKKRSTSNGVDSYLKQILALINVFLRHIQYQGETLPLPLVLAFGQVLGKFHI